MLIGIEGGLGDGKTILMVRYLKKDASRGRKIKTNFHLYDIDYDLLDIVELLENESHNVEMNNVSLGVDEITVFADCRTSTSKMNRIFSYFILQSRKRNNDIYYTTQDFDMVDYRMIRHTHIQVVANKIYDESDEVIPHIRNYKIYDLRNRKKIKTFSFDMDISRFYDNYDTNEVILPPMNENRLGSKKEFDIFG